MNVRGTFWRAGKGFTLLEMLLAVTILASVSTLIASLWAQTHAWTSENTGLMQSMRLPRVYELVRRQWGDRRTAVDLDQNKSTTVARHDALTFITATPLLNPDAAMVQVTYRIEPQGYDMFGKPRAWNLVYEEADLMSFVKEEGPLEESAEERFGELRRHMLLESCTQLAFERFGHGMRMPSLRSGADQDVDDSTRGRGAGAGGEEAAEEDPDAQRFRWRAFEQEQYGSVMAVRLVGNFEGEEIVWPFVIEALR